VSGSSSGGGESSIAVTLNQDGTVVIGTPVFDQGTGTYTTLRQVVSEELGLPAEEIAIEVLDTDHTAFDSGIGGSRGTHITTGSAYQAAVDAKAELLHLVSEALEWPVGQIGLDGRDVTRQGTGERRAWAEVLTRVGRSVRAEATYKYTAHAPVTGFTAQVAEVSVDPETGEVKLLRFTSAHDVGTVLNPIGHQGQINGGVMQGIGYGLLEEVMVENGRVTTPSFGDFKIPTIQDIPELRTVLLEPHGGVGPYNIKGIGENPTVPVAAAIANAIEDASGARVRDLPATAERVLRALQG
jgi:CO/xanthine dehydrogenase Mo-binding subunit